MKPPRWLVTGMLATSTLAVLVAAGCWWVTWPERTAREFVELLNCGKVEEATRMSPRVPELMGSAALYYTEHTGRSLHIDSRSWADYASGRLPFRVCMEPGSASEWFIELDAVRGQVYGRAP